MALLPSISRDRASSAEGTRGIVAGWIFCKRTGDVAARKSEPMAGTLGRLSFVKWDGCSLRWLRRHPPSSCCVALRRSSLARMYEQMIAVAYVIRNSWFMAIRGRVLV